MAAGTTEGKAGELKEQGNAEYKQGNYLKAAAIYTKAVKEDASNAVLYSNRSAALLRLNKFSKAMADAEECIRLKPDWDKGFIRRGAILEAQEKVDEALADYRTAQQLNSSNSEVAAKVKGITRTIALRNRALGKHMPAAAESATAGPKAAAAAAAAGAAAAVALAAAESSAMAFSEEWLRWAKDEVIEGGTGFAPIIHFQAGPSKEQQQVDPEQLAVKGAQAFNSPELLTNFIGFLREHGEKLGSEAVCSVVPKQAVAYPQQWRQAGWPFPEDQDGVFVQLESKAVRKLWFIRVNNSNVPMNPREVNYEYALLPTLLRTT